MYFLSSRCRFEVSLQRIDQLKNFDVRYIVMEDLETGNRHEVIHLNFTAWPDHGAPETAVPLLKVSSRCTDFSGVFNYCMLVLIIKYVCLLTIFA